MATIDGATISTAPTAGVDAPMTTDSILTGPIAVDLADDPDTNGVPGPHYFPAPTVMASYELSLAASSLEIEFSEIEVLLDAGVLSLMLTTDPGAVPPGGQTVTVCTLDSVPVSFPVQ